MLPEDRTPLLGRIWFLVISRVFFLFLMEPV